MLPSSPISTRKAVFTSARFLVRVQPSPHRMRSIGPFPSPDSSPGSKCPRSLEFFPCPDLSLCLTNDDNNNNEPMTATMTTTTTTATTTTQRLRVTKARTTTQVRLRRCHQVRTLRFLLLSHSNLTLRIHLARHPLRRLSISAIQWLLNTETSHPTPCHHLMRFFTTLPHSIDFRSFFSGNYRRLVSP